MFSFLSRLSSTETFSHFYTLTFLINMFYLKAFSSVFPDETLHSDIFFKTISDFSYFVLKVNLKVSSFSPSALVWTHFGSEAWNCSHQWRFDICIFESLKLDQDRHLDSSLLSSHISRRLFYFILFYFLYFFYICPFVANILKVSFHQQLHVTLKVLGSLWYLFNILKTNSTTNIRRRFMFLKFGTKSF